MKRLQFKVVRDFFKKKANIKNKIIDKYKRKYNGSSSTMESVPNTIKIVMGINVAVFVSWQYYDRRFMKENFTFSLESMKNRPWTIVTSGVSHKDFLHLIFNTLGLYFLGAPIIGLLGSGRFVGFFIASNAVSFVSNTMYYNYLSPQFFRAPAMDIPSLGCSGSLLGSLALFSLFFPKQTFLLYGIIPLPAYLLLGGALAYETYSLLYSNDNISHAGHLGGAFYGFLYYLYLRMKYVKR
eukprot:TRINITY_DN17352_c0_g1_i1.p1 TRINITY_DN17352_c0_g1~~TRINITY_DN17352_c0_g1_i1.p1  ORF type:complete len:250 (+),score=40.29 TRINITY_DN17352_c0_g1_i1:35-751(+)